MELIQAACVLPTVNVLRDRGVNVERHLETAGLTAFKWQDPKSWLPKESVFDFIDIIDKKELSSKPVEDLESGYRLDNMAHYGEYLLSSKNMLQAAGRAASPNACTITYHRVGISLSGLSPTIFSKYGHPDERAEKIIEGCSLVLMLDAVLRFGGKSSELKSLDITLDEFPKMSLPIDFSNTQIRVSQSAHVAKFPAKWLLRRIETGHECSKIPDPAPDDFISHKILSLLYSLAPGDRPSIQQFAVVCGRSTRSLQRQLRHEGTTFFELVDQWAMNVAKVRLVQTENTVLQISGELGYSDSAHFIRAFNRWTGTSPSSYRKQN